MDLSSVKSVTPNKHLFKKIIAVMLSLVVIVVSFIIIDNSNKDSRETIEVVRVRQNGGIQANSVITEKQIEKYNLIKKEYTSDMLLAEDMSSIIGKYSKNYMRDKTVIYKDEVGDEIPVKNEWLYKVNEKNEVITLPYDYLKCGGDILMPGDRVRIRVSYEVEETTVPQESYDNPNLVITQTQDKTIKTEILFDDIVIKDMLNSNSHSIYEVYKEVSRLSEDKRESVMKSDEFLKNIQPKALMLEGTMQQINNFAKYNGFEGKSFLITILSRKDSNVIGNQLPTLQSEVEKWIEKENQQ
ncbi:flagellar biosynthesis protein FlgA [Ruminiclostridium herbifermentans]|uniref:Flagellar biosynthesis protein FlgA n=1 Tax=Ruminiclostridium herbifermentans TaxID=2488810 RepID=A0A4U7JEP4_9FIRM|nr:flagellar biosynthesis protein FlgA [Ruminiclostridium herbifermentans]QNU67802.1 flagellar biosynthesis protein FlgA [Ruminiclostridium herbifermentans]